MNLEIIPHIGFGPVKLGMSREDVKAILGEESYSGSHKRSDYYYSNSLQVEFLEGELDFIGISFSAEYMALYEQKNVFDMSALDLFELISSNESESHSFNESSCLFPNQIITLWDADQQYDRIGGERRVVWAQVGIGSKAYCCAVSKYA